MSFPYLDPNDAPWTAEYRESYGYKLENFDDDHSRYWCDENEDEFWDSFYNVV